jgi:hypothetical protein
MKITHNYNEYIKTHHINSSTTTTIIVGFSSNLAQRATAPTTQTYIFKSQSHTPQFTSIQVPIFKFLISHHQTYLISRTVRKLYFKLIPVYGVYISVPYNLCHDTYVKTYKNCLKLRSEFKKKIICSMIYLAIN